MRFKVQGSKVQRLRLEVQRFWVQRFRSSEGQKIGRSKV